VIQGSVLGPILFILFIADINDYLTAGAEIEKYADDILAYVISKGESGLQISEAVAKWCRINKMNQ
jgi:hypothetical protein